jgi:tetratricopeptide (TPR) repeat protein
VHASGLLFPSRGLLVRTGGAVLLIVLPLSLGTFVRNDIWTEEVKLWNDVVLKSPDKPIGYNNRGMAYAKRGNFEAALDDLSRAISYFPKNMSERAKWENADMTPVNMAKSFVGRGDVYIALGDTERAKADYQRSRKLMSMPVNVDNRLVLADRYAKRGAYKHAIEEYNKILEWDPEHIEALNDRANAYSYLGRYPEAIRDLSRVIALDPDFILAYHNRGIARVWTGKQEQALEDFEQACERGFLPSCESAQAVRGGGR